MRSSILIVLLTCCLGYLAAQIDSSLLVGEKPDSVSAGRMNMDAVYNRPFQQIGNLPVTLGGYVEADYSYVGEDGIIEGHSFRMPRLTVFIAASTDRRIRFLSEIELEEGGEEIAIEFAALDFAFHPLLHLRGGIVMNPIGAFNQNHDGPKWEFSDRPVAMTQMLPATWSNVGFGAFGKYYRKNWALGYEFYVTNGFDESIISNVENKTFLPAAKDNSGRFEESLNGKPLFTGKIAVRNEKIGELGFSYMGGVYNTFEEDGLQLADPLGLNVWAIDVQAVIPGMQTKLIGEWAWVHVEIPSGYTQQYGDRQRGGFLDIVQPIYHKSLLGFKGAVINAACRIEYVDWNAGTFSETNGNIAEDLWSIVPGVSFRPVAQTVIRLNYRYSERRDLLGNAPAKSGGVQIGIASYF